MHNPHEHNKVWALLTVNSGNQQCECRFQLVSPSAAYCQDRSFVLQLEGQRLGLEDLMLQLKGGV